MASFTLSKDFLWHILITHCNPLESLTGGFMLPALSGNGEEDEEKEEGKED